MKIGILTFHSQLNYGGVLQCWALQTALEQLGHDVVVVDRWMSVDNFMLECGYDKWSYKKWIKFWIRSLLGFGDMQQWLRARRTKRFLSKYIKRTPYHFTEWQDAPKDLGVDMLVVGSDQVWHCGDWGDPRVYLLEGAPEIPAISYAASFGMSNMPMCYSWKEFVVESRPVYERGFRRFKAISCREAEGANLCRNFGVTAEHVVDPTLLLSIESWRLLTGTIKPNAKKSLVCYFLSTDYSEALPLLEEFARKMGCCVDVLVDQWVRPELLPLPTNFSSLKRWIAQLSNILFGQVQVRFSAGPVEFLKSIASADWVLSDSFHALMFSLIFGKNVRILAPRQGCRLQMFARIEEFASHIDGNLIVKDISEALDSYSKTDKIAIDFAWLEERRKASLGFLARHICK